MLSPSDDSLLMTVQGNKDTSVCNRASCRHLPDPLKVPQATYKDHSDGISPSLMFELPGGGDPVAVLLFIDRSRGPIPPVLPNDRNEQVRGLALQL